VDICGIQRLTSSQWTGGVVPSAPNTAFSNGGTITQALAATLANSTLYTLSVSVGRRLDSTFTSYLIELLAGSAAIAIDNTTKNPASGSFVVSTLTYQSLVSDPLAGQTLSILLKGNSGGQPNFDAVSLDASAVGAVPEPGTAALCLIGLALVCVQRLRAVLARR